MDHAKCSNAETLVYAACPGPHSRSEAGAPRDPDEHADTLSLSDLTVLWSGRNCAGKGS
jgi:hypothetical protein